MFTLISYLQLTPPACCCSRMLFLLERILLWDDSVMKQNLEINSRNLPKTKFCCHKFGTWWLFVGKSLMSSLIQRAEEGTPYPAKIDTSFTTNPRIPHSIRNNLCQISNFRNLDKRCMIKFRKKIYANTKTIFSFQNKIFIFFVKA